MRRLENNIIKTAEILKALGHPARLEMLRMINASKDQALTVKQIHENLGIPQPEASRHLILMKNQSILFCERKDGHSFYRINDEFDFIKSFINI